MGTQYTQTSGIPLSIAVFLATDHYDHNDDPYTISATTLIKPVRQIILGARAKTDDVMVDLGNMMASRIGTAIHSGIELAWSDPDKRSAALAVLGYPKKIIDRVKVNPTPEWMKNYPDTIPVYMEIRMSKTVGKWTVTGKPDFIGEGYLEDFKTASSFVVTSNINDEKFGWQGSIYRWISPDLITKPDMKIQFIITDWSSMMAKQNPAYPQSRHVQRIIPLKPIAEVDRMVSQKLSDIEKYWDADETDIPECSMDDLQRSEPKYKYYKSGDTTAARSTKNFDTMQEAMAHMHGKEGGKGAIKEVPGQVTACRFCAAFSVCSQKDRLVAAGELTL